MCSTWRGEAQRCGTVVSAVMLGAIAGSGLFPFAREHYESVVRGGGQRAEASLRGFARAFEIVQRDAGSQHDAGRVPRSRGAAWRTDADRQRRCRCRRASPAGFPAPVHDMLALGHARMLEYQDARLRASCTCSACSSVLDAERAADPQAQHGFATTREMARWLALWMAFDDIVRVADLKSRASRWQRVKGEVKAGDDDLLRVYDHFKPGAPEFAALLPTPLASRVLQLGPQARAARGKTPWALPLKIGTHSVVGMLALRTLASLKWLRVRGSRYANEQAMIEQLAGRRGRRQPARLAAGPRDRPVRPPDQGLWRHQRARQGEPAARAGPPGEAGDPAAAARAIAAAREAALADDAGKALDATLVQHGAPRPAAQGAADPLRAPAAQGTRTVMGTIRPPGKA